MFVYVLEFSTAGYEPESWIYGVFASLDEAVAAARPVLKEEPKFYASFYKFELGKPEYVADWWLNKHDGQLLDN